MCVLMINELTESNLTHLIYVYLTNHSDFQFLPIDGIAT